MASSHSSSSSSLCDVDALRARLEEKDNILRTSAQYGKDLLDQNRELTQILDETTYKFTRQLEILKEENYSLTQKLEHKERMEEEYQDENESLKKHLASQRDELKVLNELTDQSQLISELRSRIREIEAVSDKSELDNKQLRNLVASCKEQIDEANSRLTAMQDNLNDTASDEVASLLRELNEAISERDNANRNCMLHQNEIHSLAQQLESHLHQISSLQEELASANSQLSNMSNSFMATTQENQELRCEIDMLRMNDRDHKKKGNSMFSELDDKRQEAEKKLLLLNVQYESLVNQYSLSKKQMSKLKLQMSNILRLASGQVDSNHVAELESQLTEARNEVRSLTVKLSKLSTTESPKIPQSIKGASAVEGDHRTLQFVESLLVTKDEELKAMKKELHEKRLAATYNTQQLNDVQHRLRNMESKANKLHAQNIQLSVKLEDIKAKYEVESTTNTRLERGRVEDIPDFNAEMANALLGADSMAENTQVMCDDDAENKDTVSSAASNDQLDSASIATYDTHSLCEIQQNIDSTETDSKSLIRRRHTPGLYFTKEVTSPMSSTDSLWGGDQVNAKFYDNLQTKVEEKKVINVKSSEQDANSCPTQ